MTEQEIRDKAPSGATHYILNDQEIIYVKNMMIWFRNSWWFATFNTDQLKPL